MSEDELGVIVKGESLRHVGITIPFWTLRCSEAFNDAKMGGNTEKSVPVQDNLAWDGFLFG
ncbi:hypothetical protein TY91_04605 [Secundilactobacillus collinoides]|uniref:Uncharacterized protein n=1 Tax=Secundilactobacillus collinoides TaxID=33960 RepID=A0A161VJU8_SECCO|nr:hypothetical protein TY91_04605 [Secundilactobacillus collinoides]